MGSYICKKGSFQSKEKRERLGENRKSILYRLSELTGMNAIANAHSSSLIVPPTLL